jgi:hypothetical protein
MHPRSLSAADEVVGVDGVSVSGVAVHDQQQIGLLGEHARGIDHLSRTHQSDVELAPPTPWRRTGDAGADARVFDDLRVEAVVDAYSHEDFVPFDEFP